MKPLKHHETHFEPAIDSITESAQEEIISPKNIIECFEGIVTAAEDSGLPADFTENISAKPYIDFACAKLKLKPWEIVLLALINEIADENGASISEITNFVDCRRTRIQAITPELEHLERLKYIRVNRGHTYNYRIPRDVMRRLAANKRYIFKEEPLKTVAAFIDRYRSIMNERCCNALTIAEVRSRTKGYLKQIKDTEFVKALTRYDLKEDSLMIFIEMAVRAYCINDNDVVFKDLCPLFYDGDIPFSLREDMRNEDSELYRKGLIETVVNDGLAQPGHFTLTKKARQEVLCELNLNTRAAVRNDLISPDKLVEKHLVYNAEESAQIDRLGQLLKPDNFAGVQERLTKAGMRKGFCCIFHGTPGTGKTETVFQLARLTGRKIMRVDIDKIKDKFVGETEKNIKNIFDSYRELCRTTTPVPILLFNEADGILGKRMEGVENSVDKMNNSMQNIILQEMESLEGIMIATTNLTSNLDGAFERRFLYKVNFHKPEAGARQQIWKGMLPDLSDADACSLASEFEFSGGQIENIVRKYTVDSILSGVESANINTLAPLCKQEILGTSNRRPIGFFKSQVVAD